MIYFKLGGISTCRHRNKVITMDDTNLSDLTREVEDEGEVIFCCILINA
jgi:hypothetical protein